MSKLLSMRDAIAEHVPDGSSVALGLQMEQMIPFAAGHEIMRQRKKDLRLIGPISDVLFDQIIGAGCVKDVVAAWVGNVMMGSAYNFRRAVEQQGMKVFNMTNFSVALALEAGAMGVPFLPTRTAMGSDVVKGNHFFYQIISPVQGYYKRDDAAFQQYHEESKTPEQFDVWAERWVYGVRDRVEYVERLGARSDELRVKKHAYAAQADFGY